MIKLKECLKKKKINHLTVRTDDGDDLFVDTNDVWDDGDRVGIRIAPSYIRLYKKSKDESVKSKDEE